MVQVVVNGMRVRIKLDEIRLAEMVQGMEASAIPGLLRHLGDLASTSFIPYQNGKNLYLLCLALPQGSHLHVHLVPKITLAHHRAAAHEMQFVSIHRSIGAL